MNNKEQSDRQESYRDRPARVLVVDDDADLRFYMAECLERAGYQPILSGDGMEALYALDVQRPHLAVVDLNMPVMSGFRLLRLLRGAGKPDRPRLPIIVISCDDLQEAMDLVVETKPEAYLQKPFDPEQLIERVGHLLAPLAA